MFQISKSIKKCVRFLIAKCDSFIANCDNFIIKLDSYYKMQRLLQIAAVQSVTRITAE